MTNTPKMSIPKSGGDFEKARVTPGMTNAKLYSIVDLGTEYGEYNGKKTAQRKFQLTFETQQTLTFTDKNTKKEVEKHLVIGKKYTLSLADSSRLRADLKTWLGKEPDEGFDIFSMAGKTAFIQVIEDVGKNDITYSNISVILPGQVDFPLVNPIQLFSLEKDFFNVETFKKLPERQQKIIVKSPEYKAVTGGDEQEEYGDGDGEQEGYDPNEDLPF